MSSIKLNCAAKLIKKILVLSWADIIIVCFVSLSLYLKLITVPYVIIFFISNQNQMFQCVTQNSYSRLHTKLRDIQFSEKLSVWKMNHMNFGSKFHWHLISEKHFYESAAFNITDEIWRVLGLMMMISQKWIY